MGERGRWGASPRKGLGAPSQSTGRRRLIPRFPSLASLFALYASACILHPSSHAAAYGSCFFASPPTLRRFRPPSHPVTETVLLLEEAEVGERLLSHASLGSWSTPSLSKLAVADQVGAMLQGWPRRAEPTLRWSLLIKPRRAGAALLFRLSSAFFFFCNNSARNTASACIK